MMKEKNINRVHKSWNEISFCIIWSEEVSLTCDLIGKALSVPMLNSVERSEQNVPILIQMSMDFGQIDNKSALLKLLPEPILTKMSGIMYLLCGYMWITCWGITR